MGNIFQPLFAGLFGSENIKILMVGLLAAGKMDILYKLKLGEIVTTTPAKGFNVSTVKYKNINFTSFDVGGKNDLKQWRHLWQDTKVLIWDGKYLFELYTMKKVTEVILAKTKNTLTSLIFVVDSHDWKRVDDAKEELWKILSEDDLRYAVLLVFSNNKCLPNALSDAEITEKLSLGQIRNRNWYIQATCSTDGVGLYEGLDWLSNKLKKLKGKT